MIQKNITYCGRPVVLACDAQCQKAWGINNRPSVTFGDDPDDFAFKSDSEIEDDAPTDPGTYEGGVAKPETPGERLNKWCARECERSIMKPPTEELVLKDFSKRIYNKKTLHPEATT